MRHRHAQRQLARRRRVDRKACEVDAGVAHLVGDRGLQVGLRDEAHLHQPLAERRVADRGLGERAVELVAGQHAELEQRVADGLDRHAALVPQRLQQLRRRGDPFLGRHVERRRPDFAAAVGGARHELAPQGVVVVARHEHEEALLRLDVAAAARRHHAIVALHAQLALLGGARHALGAQPAGLVHRAQRRREHESAEARERQCERRRIGRIVEGDAAR